MKNKNDNRLKILSLVVAIVMWAFVINSTNPSVNKIYRQIPVVIRNQDDLEKSGYTIVGAEQRYTTTVKLKGSRERLINLKPENIYASVDISNLREGVQSLQIDVDTPQGVTVDELEPSNVTLNIQKVLEKTLPVNLIIDDAIKDGRLVEVNEISPEEIIVKGPASMINNVDRVEARIDDEKLLDGKIHNIDLVVIDKAGNPIDNVNISHDDINISFIVYETKEVSVRMFTSGNIDKKYQEVSRTISPDKIIIKGPGSVLRDIDQIKSKVININGLKESVAGEIKLDLPESVEVYNGENSASYKIELKKRPDDVIVIGGSNDKKTETTEDNDGM